MSWQPCTTRWPWLAWRLLPAYGFQHRGACLLDLEEQRIVLARHQEHDATVVPTLPTPTTLIGDVHELETVEQQRAGVPARFPGSRQRPCWTFAMCSSWPFFAPVIDERRVFPDGRRQTVGVHQFGKIMFQHAAFAGLGQALLDALARFFVLDRRDQLFHVDAVIPHVQDPHLAVFGHVLAIGPHAASARHRGASSSLKPLSRQASTKLAARRFTSHSQGAGSVSSRSLMSKITRRSGVA